MRNHSRTYVSLTVTTKSYIIGFGFWLKDFAMQIDEMDFMRCLQLSSIHFRRNSPNFNPISPFPGSSVVQLKALDMPPYIIGFDKN